LSRIAPTDKNAAPANPPVPLAIVINRAGLTYRQIFRENDIAVYRAQKDNRLELETIRVQIIPAEEINGKSYPCREAFPSSSQWGECGWTFTNNSHRDPLSAAMAKARQLGRKSKQ